MTQVLIPSAGLGTRLGTLSKNINKALIPVGKKPSICYVIDFYPTDYKFIIALGYKGKFIRDFLEISYPNRDFTFVEVDKFEGKGSGLGYTLKKCKKHINESFFFHTNDTLILDKINFDTFNEDTIFSNQNNANCLKYRTVKVSKNHVTKLFDKTTKKLNNVYNYTGVAFVKDYKKFKKYLSKISIGLGESDYFINILNQDKKIKNFYVNKWYDVGDIVDLRKAQKEISDFDNLPKEDEFIYFKNNKVIKFFINKKIVLQKIIRAKNISKFIPKIVDKKSNFFAYNYEEGELLSQKIDFNKYFNTFLIYCNDNFWQRYKLTKDKRNEFYKECLNFYYDKTIDRLNLFYQNHDIFDTEEIINHNKSPKLKVLLEKINWQEISKGIPSRFHGDFHFENIIINKNNDYKFIDWRQSFGNIIEYGDLYYDLAKLYHGIIVDHGAIRNNMFKINLSKSKRIVNYEIYRKHSSYENEITFMKFLKKYKFNIHKVKTLTALIFLNIATLHHQPYSIFLYFLGKDMINKILND